MKAMAISGILALLILVICVLAIGYVEQATDQMKEELETCITLAQTRSIKEAIAYLPRVKEVWQQKRNVLMMYADQTILDEVDEHLEQMEVLGEHHEEEFVPAAVSCIGKLDELRQRETITAYSWF